MGIGLMILGQLIMSSLAILTRRYCRRTARAIVGGGMAGAVGQNPR